MQVTINSKNEKLEVYLLNGITNTAIMLNQSLTQKQNLKISPQQIEFLNILHLTNQQLEAKLKNELLENPFLEVDAKDAELKDEKANEPDFLDQDEYIYDDKPDYQLEYQNYFSQDQIPSAPIPAAKDFREELIEQLMMKDLSVDEFAIGNYIINSISEDGLLENTLENLCDDYCFGEKKFVTPEVFNKVLQIIKQLDPIGIASKNSQECLIAQLKANEVKSVVNKKALMLLENHFHLLKSAQVDKICEVLSIEEDEFKIIVEYISKFNSKPIVQNSGAMAEKNTIIPDFLVTIEDDNFQISLTNRYSKSVRINNDWQTSITSNNTITKDANHYIKSKMNAAQWFISAIEQRENTMMKIMKAIVEYQKDYFLEGDESLLKPMVLKNIADKVALDISTISRTTSNKYVDTHFGVVLLKNLFTEGLINEAGESVSNKVIQLTLSQIIQTENRKHPYTDQQLVELLFGRGISIARRTVTKYRESLQIPMSQMRRLWA